LEIEGMLKQTGLGKQELELLRYVTDNSPVTVREASDGFGTPRGLARTTILTVMERLRKKGYLTRRRKSSSFEYLPAVSKQDLMLGLVQDFVEKTLDGSLTPFVAYIAKNKGLSESEIDELRKLIGSLSVNESGDDDVA
jgi:predicted transcriptional regulator